jgi:hypothetical protein
MTGASLLTPLGDELLDHPDADPRSVEESLRNIALSNRWFGGWWAVRRGLRRILAGVPQGTTLTLLDVGTGNGDLPQRATPWAKRRGITLVPLGLERHRTAAGLARDGGLKMLLGCAGALPIRPKSVDIVLASQLVHHLTPSAIVDFFVAANRIARVGVVVADLRRSPVALAGFWIGARLFGFDDATKADGITSVRRGFHRREMAGLLRDAGVDATVEQTPGFRLVASWKAG